MSTKSLQEHVNNVFILDRKAARRAQDKLEMLLHKDEKIELFTIGSYNNSNGILCLNESRLLFVCRNKDERAVVVELYYNEILDLFIKKSVVESAITFITHNREVKIDYLDKKESIKIKEFTLGKIKGANSKINNPKTSPDANVTSGLGSRVRLLSDILNPDKGWPFENKQVIVIETNSSIGSSYELVLFGMKVSISECNEVISVNKHKKMQNCITLTYFFDDLSLLNPTEILEFNSRPDRVCTFGVTGNKRICLSAKIPTYYGLDLDVARRLLLCAFVTLIQEVKKVHEEMSSGDILSKEMNISSATEESNSFEWSELFDFVGTVVDIIELFNDDD